MTKKIKWRLGELPTPEEVGHLHNLGLLTKDEAREILFKEEEETARDVKSLESEIKFLRDLVERLSKSSGKIVETIRLIEKPYYNQPWYQPYQVWCGLGSTSITSGSNTMLYNTATTQGQLGSTTGGMPSGVAQANYTSAGGGGMNGFNTIKTF